MKKAIVTCTRIGHAIIITELAVLDLEAYEFFFFLNRVEPRRYDEIKALKALRQNKTFWFECNFV